MTFLYIFLLQCAFGDETITSKLDQIQVNLNFVWVIMSGALVFFMQAGFMCLESGMARAKNSINVAIKNLTDFVVGTITFWFFGFALMFGASQGGWFGWSNFRPENTDSWVIAFFVFQSVFVGTAATIDSGAVAGRVKYSAYLFISLFVSGIIYPIFGHWAWGSLLISEQQGWLEKMGFIDFAGSTVVHSVGAWVALVAVIMVRPRIGRFNEDGSANKFHPSNMPLVFLGTFILAVGWFGFNCGSTVTGDASIAPIAFNTMISACFGCFAIGAISWFRSDHHAPEGDVLANGFLGGLVGITAGCASVTAFGSIMIGLFSGIAVYYGTIALEKLQIDDVVGAVPVHGFCGALGTLMLPFFLTEEAGKGIDVWNQFGVQATGVLACLVWTTVTTFLVITVAKWIFGGIRVKREDEILGLNVSEHGAKSSILEIVNNMATATSTGNFSKELEVEVEYGTQMGELADGFNQVLTRIRETLEEMERQKQIAEKEKESANELSNKIKNEKLKSDEALRLAQESKEEIERQGKEIQERNRTLVGIVDELVQNVTEVRQQFEEVGNSGVSVQKFLNGLSQKSTEVQRTVEIIREITLSTKLLGFNAMVEAARAGEHGKSFSVVAQEIQDLSLATEGSSNEIEDVIKEVIGAIESILEKTTKQMELISTGRSSVEECFSLIQGLERIYDESKRTEVA